MISPRFVPAICVLTALALVPTWIHSYSGAVMVDGRSASAIPQALGPYRGAPTARNPNWGMRRFESEDWIERTYTDGARELRLTVVRSYDAKTLYHHPELAIAYGPSFQPATTETLPGTDVPVHVLRPAAGGNVLALYVLRYDDRFVAAPIAFQIRNAGELLFSRRKPMTLFFVTDESAPADAPLERLESAGLLKQTIDAFLAQTPAAAAASE